MTPPSGLVQYLICLALGYLIGSFPTAYLLVQWRRRFDIRRAGTGNVGAMNAYDVTGSKLLGLAVLAVDVAKGALAAWLAAAIAPGDVWSVGSAGIGAVAGHSFSPWLGFKGGRGLATCAGVMLVTAWPVIAVWTCIWAIHYAASRNLHGANIVATVLSPVVLAVVPRPLAAALIGYGESYQGLVLPFSVMCVIILTRHAGYFRKILPFIV